jgi:hypothetical protein
MGCRGRQQKILEFIHAWRITAAMPNMDNDQLITANVVVDEESITRRWNHANAGNIRLPSEPGMVSQQPGGPAYLTDDRRGCARTVLRDLLMDFGNVGPGTRRIP